MENCHPEIEWDRSVNKFLLDDAKLAQTFLQLIPKSSAMGTPFPNINVVCMWFPNFNAHSPHQSGSDIVAPTNAGALDIRPRRVQFHDDVRTLSPRILDHATDARQRPADQEDAISKPQDSKHGIVAASQNVCRALRRPT
ncbi:unnamed protein product [Prorocentrum cordatum]|uniref:Uncharacterized protein n=1 Tax=Prorocentrum cordatum TaxID=2364126 RepID=A0ABN9XPF8_9DINO|nr:unnamed protein product [Polarella glacialis]